MTQNKAFKKAVRARMAETGEPYSVARRAVYAERERELTNPVGKSDVWDNPGRDGVTPEGPSGAD